MAEGLINFADPFLIYPGDLIRAGPNADQARGAIFLINLRGHHRQGDFGLGQKRNLRWEATDMAKAMITCSGVHKSFGDKPVLQGINFEVCEAEVVVIIGPVW